MNDRKTILRIGSFILDLTEIWIPTLAFAALFVVFMVQVVARYFFVPLIWPLEFSLMMYIWTILLGSCFALRDDSHVSFSLVYDRVTPKGQRIMRVAGNLLVVIAFCIALYPSGKFVDFMGFKKSDALRIPMNFAFSPFMVFLLLVIGRLGRQVALDVRDIVRGREAK
ncbi:MAG: TRAP transporter small permease [Spirochaetales bacterium]|nr:TRAP transporter small permease [Spirochaetales bacterium]